MRPATWATCRVPPVSDISRISRISVDSQLPVVRLTFSAPMSTSRSWAVRFEPVRVIKERAAYTKVAFALHVESAWLITDQKQQAAFEIETLTVVEKWKDLTFFDQRMIFSNLQKGTILPAKASNTVFPTYPRDEYSGAELLYCSIVLNYIHRDTAPQSFCFLFPTPIFQSGL